MNKIKNSAKLKTLKKIGGIHGTPNSTRLNLIQVVEEYFVRFIEKKVARKHL